MKAYAARFGNVLIRVLTMAGKFLLIMVVAKYLPSRDLALYGLLTVTIGYLLMVIGFDFYNYSSRQLFTSAPNLWVSMLRDQALFFYVIT